MFCTLLTLPNDKFLDWSNLKELADKKIDMTEKLKFLLARLENIVGKGENAGYLTVFSEGFITRVVKSRDCVVKS